MIGWILIVVGVVVLIFGLIPAFPYRGGYTAGPGLLLIVVGIVLLLLGV